MNEFTTMYHYFKEFSNTSGDKSVAELKIEHQLPPTEECTNDSYPTAHYLEMKSGSDNNNNDVSSDKDNSVANINYLNVSSDIESFDVVDAAGTAIEMQPMKKRDSRDLLNNLNDMRIKEEDEKEMTNELKITEDNYYDSNALNKAPPADDFSNECSDVLENVSHAETSSMTPSINSIPSSSSDNQQSLHSSDYLIQPSNRPVTNAFSDYLTHPSNKPLEETADSTSHDYMNQSAVRGNLSSIREASHLRLYFKKKSDSISEDGAGYSKIRELASPTKSVRSTGTLKRTDSDASKKSVDDELVEIINDFKNNVFTIQEVEELVSSWKNRNDVKNCFRDKQDQLQKMREEYERIQHKMKENLKRPSPFERMKRIFSRKQEKEIPTILPINLTGDPKYTLTNGSGNRPNSTLSLASSNSSGRMSTSSSLGDSGTHSDHEERRNQHAFRVGQPGSLMTDNYLIPPAPRPISTPSSTPAEEKEGFPNFPSSSDATSSEHYIMFPSNQPYVVPIFPSPPPYSMSTFKGNR